MVAEKKHGIVSVEIGDDNVIYHAMFEPLNDRNLLPQSLVRAIDTRPQKEAPKEENWEHKTKVLFSMEEENAIQMDIQMKEKTHLIYKFYPLA